MIATGLQLPGETNVKKRVPIKSMKKFGRHRDEHSTGHLYDRVAERLNY